MNFVRSTRLVEANPLDVTHVILGFPNAVSLSGTNEQNAATDRNKDFPQTEKPHPLLLGNANKLNMDDTQCLTVF